MPKRPRHLTSTHRAGVSLLTVCYVFGLLATIGHLACAHAACLPACEDQPAHEHAPLTGQQTVLVANAHGSCDHDDHDDHVAVPVADQKAGGSSISPMAILTATIGASDAGYRSHRPAANRANARHGLTDTAPSRAPPTLRFS